MEKLCLYLFVVHYSIPIVKINKIRKIEKTPGENHKRIFKKCVFFKTQKRERKSCTKTNRLLAIDQKQALSTRFSDRNSVEKNHNIVRQKTLSISFCYRIRYIFLYVGRWCWWGVKSHRKIYTCNDILTGSKDFKWNFSTI